VISDYATNLIGLMQDATKHEIDPQELLLTSNVALHLYTQGVVHETALAFFESMMQEYVSTQLPPLATGRLRLQVTEILQILQYHSTFPDIFFEEQNSNLPQLCIRVNVLNLDSCSHIQTLLDQSAIEKNMLGMQMLVRVIDTPTTPVTCTRTMKMAYTNKLCGAPAIDSAEFLLRMALGGTIITSNASCTVENKDCVAELTSSDTGLFNDVLQIINTQVDPFVFLLYAFCCGFRPRCRIAGSRDHNRDHASIWYQSPLPTSHSLKYSIISQKFQNSSYVFNTLERVKASQSELECVRASQSESERVRVGLRAVRARDFFP